MIEFFGGIVVGAGLQYVFMLYLDGPKIPKTAKPKWVPFEPPLRVGRNYLDRTGAPIQVHSIEGDVAFVRWHGALTELSVNGRLCVGTGPSIYDVTHQEASEP